jgi:hypothetical protein
LVQGRQHLEKAPIRRGVASISIIITAPIAFYSLGRITAAALGPQPAL